MKKLTNIYQVKLRRHNGQGELLNVLHYKYIENAFADIMNRSGDIFGDFVPKSFYKELQSCKMKSVSIGTTENGDEIADDFEFYFDSADIFCYVGKIMTED